MHVYAFNALKIYYMFFKHYIVCNASVTTILSFFFEKEDTRV